MPDYKAIFSERLGPRGDFPACFAFSIHKAGSTLMHKMIADVCIRSRIPSLSIPDTLFLEGIKDREWQADPGILDLVEEGRLYYGFRYLPAAFLDPRLGLRQRRSVLLVRDPRDALVSEYFSFGGRHVSHRAPDKNADSFRKGLEATADLDLDEYVLQSAQYHLAKLKAYREALDFSTVMLRRYEDIYFDKHGFLADIFSHFGIAIDPEIVRQVAAENDIRPSEEDHSRHIRKGAPGDHREKLAENTIARLNGMFGDVCRSYGYELSA